MPRNLSPSIAWPCGRRMFVLLLLLCVGNSGCIRAGALIGKVLMGDPTIKASFELQRGINLQKGQQKVAVVCSAPASVTAEFDSLAYDVQEEVTRRMRIHKLNVASDDDVISALNRTSGKFDKDAMAAALEDVDFIIHIDIEQFTHTEDGNPELYHGRANGIVHAYEVERDPESGGGPHALQMFFQEFTTEYPKNQPVSADQMAARVFRQKCVDQLADVVGRMFYDVATTDILF